MSRPDPKDVFALKPGIFSWIRDQAYDFVYYDIGTGLDFVGDLFRGPSGYSQSLHRQSDKAQARAPNAQPLTKSQQAVFTGMLKRQPTEPQIAHWKRKKALLNHPDKQGLVVQQQTQTAAKPKITVEAPSRLSTPTRDAQQKAKARGRR